MSCDLTTGKIAYWTYPEATMTKQSTKHMLTVYPEKSTVRMNSVGSPGENLLPSAR